MRIRLNTSDEQLVGYFEIPPAVLPPTIMIWGDRVFRIHVFHKPNDCQFNYDEVVAYTITTEPIR